MMVLCCNHNGLRAMANDISYIKGIDLIQNHEFHWSYGITQSCYSIFLKKLRRPPKTLRLRQSKPRPRLHSLHQGKPKQQHFHRFYQRYCKGTPTRNKKVQELLCNSFLWRLEPTRKLVSLFAAHLQKHLTPLSTLWRAEKLPKYQNHDLSVSYYAQITYSPQNQSGKGRYHR